MEISDSKELVKKALSEEITIIPENSGCELGKKMSFIPISWQFRILVRNELRFVTFSIDTSTDCYKNLKVKEYVNTSVLMNCPNKDKNIEKVIKAVLSCKYKEYVVIEINTETITVRSVYRRYSDNEEFVNLFNRINNIHTISTVKVK